MKPALCKPHWGAFILCLALLFFFEPAFTQFSVTSVTAANNSQDICPGSEILINGTGFVEIDTSITYVYRATIGGQQLTNINRQSNTLIKATVPLTFPGQPAVLVVVFRDAYDGNNLVNTLSSSKAINVEVLSQVAYPGLTFCADGQTISPTLVNGQSTLNFQYLSGPNPQLLDPNGDLYLTSAAQGTSVIAWRQNQCLHNTDTLLVQVNPPSAPSIFDYEDSIQCKFVDPDPWPDNLVPNQGSFSSNTLALDQSSGRIYLGSSPLGNHLVTFTPAPGTCSYASSFPIHIYEEDNPYFTYPSTICKRSGNTVPDSIAQPGGTFKVPNGSKVELVNSTTGEIDPLQSTLNSGTTYALRYVTNGECPDSMLLQLDIRDISAEFSIPDTVCYNQGWITASQMNSPGTFACINQNLSIGPNQNIAGSNSIPLIDVSQLAQGQYIFEYNILYPGCTDVQQETLYVTRPNPFSFSYQDTTVCTTSNDVHVPMHPGNATLNQFWSLPANGLGLNPSTGEINSNTSAVAVPYQVFCEYESNSCVDTAETSVWVIAPVSAQLEYSSSSSVTVFCQNTGLQSPISFSPTGGRFSASGGMQVDSITGEIQTNGLPDTIYNVTYTPPPGACFLPVTVTIQVLPNSFEFEYPQDTICTSSSPMAVIINSGAQNGSFSSNPQGLNVGGSSGLIDPGQNTVQGTYSIQFTSSNSVCPTTYTSNNTITVQTPPFVTFSLPSSICKTTGTVNASNPSHTGGYFWSSSPIAIDSSGTIDLLASPAGGPFQVNYTLGEPCPVTSTQNLTILPEETPDFSYPSDSYCDNASADLPVPGAGTYLGGVYSCTDPNLSLSSNGVLNPSNSIPGLYTIVYNTGGPCPETHLDTVEILVSDDATFDYQIYSNCDSNIVANVDSSSFSVLGGRFHGDAGAVVDSISGTVDLLASTTGPHDITYRTLGNCPDEFADEMEIVPYDAQTSIAFPSDTFCSGANPVLPSVTGNPNGTFQAGPGLVWADQGTGSINLVNSQPGPYTIQYAVSSACAEVYRDEIVIQYQDETDFSYDDWYCINSGNPRPNSIATPGGIFKCSTNGIVLDSLTGEIQLLECIPGTYVVEYETNANCPGTGFFPVELRPRPLPITFLAEPDTIVCNGTQVQISSSPSRKVWFRLNGSSAVDTTLVYQSNNLQDGDRLTIYHQNDYDCLDSLSFQMQVNPYPSIVWGDYDEEITAGKQVVFPVSSTIDSTNFTFKIDASQWVSASPDSARVFKRWAYSYGNFPLKIESLSDFDPGKIVLHVEPESRGCVGQADSIQLNINPEGIGIFIPGVMTPNDNGMNDSWLVQWIPAIDPNDYSLELYNRAYGLVHRMNPLTDQWNGGSLPDGVYHWILRKANGKPADTGALTIRRK